MKCKRHVPRIFFSYRVFSASKEGEHWDLRARDNVAIIPPGVGKCERDCIASTPGNPINRRRHPIGACIDDDRVPPWPSSFILLPRERRVRAYMYAHAQALQNAALRLGCLSLSAVSLAAEVVQPSFTSGRLSERQPAGMRTVACCTNG